MVTIVNWSDYVDKTVSINSNNYIISKKLINNVPGGNLLLSQIKKKIKSSIFPHENDSVLYFAHIYLKIKIWEIIYIQQ